MAAHTTHVGDQIKTAVVGNIAKSKFKYVKNLPKAKIFDLCEELWQSGFMEESFIACYWSLLIHKNYMPDDFTVFEKWVGTYLNNWASCDTLCNHDRGYVLHSAIFQIVANNFLEVIGMLLFL